MDKTAIEAIQHTAITAASIGQLGDTPAIALPNNMTVESLEHLGNRRTRFRGAMTTSIVSDFAAYTKKQASAICFVDPDKMSAQAYYNLGSDTHPGHGDHYACLTLQPTAPLKAITELNGRTNTQKALSEWLEDWLLHITAINRDGEEIDMRKAITAVRNITIEATAKSEHTDENFRASRSTLENIEAKSRSGLPAGITFDCEPYLGLKQRKFNLRLSILTGSKEPILILRITQLEKAQEEMAKEFEALLKNSLPETEMYVGRFKP